MTNRIRKVSKEIEKLKIEKEALEWLEGVFPVEYPFTAITYPSYFSMRIKTLAEFRNTPTRAHRSSRN